MGDERDVIRPMMSKEDDVEGLDAVGDVVETGEGEQVMEQEIWMEERGAVGAQSENLEVQEHGELPRGEDEVLAPRAARAPSLPSAREIEEHCVKWQEKDSTHLQVQGF